jgi:hypothetical protein
MISKIISHGFQFVKFTRKACQPNLEMSYFVSKRKSFFLVEIAGFGSVSKGDLVSPEKKLSRLGRMRVGLLGSGDRLSIGHKTTSD